MGWTGDSQVFFKTASYLTDFESFAKKHLRDVYDRQWKSGRLPQIAPFSNEDWFMWVMNGSVGWADVGILMPYWFYQKYNDRRILEEYYDGMKKYCHFMIRRCNRSLEEYESKLHLVEKFLAIRENVEKIRRLTRSPEKEPVSDVMRQIERISTDILEEL